MTETKIKYQIIVTFKDGHCIVSDPIEGIKERLDKGNKNYADWIIEQVKLKNPIQISNAHGIHICFPDSISAVTLQIVEELGPVEREGGSKVVRFAPK